MSTSLAQAIFEPAVALAEKQRRFLEATWLRRPTKARWVTENEVILDGPGFVLRQFVAPQSEDAATSAGLPILLVPPEVNASNIVDFTENQSLVRAMHKTGFQRVAVVQWLSANAQTAQRDVEHSIADIHASLEALGGRAHLVGVCQGGWESAVATALKPELVESLTLVAAPIDFFAGLGPVQFMARSLPSAFFRGLVSLGGGVMKGDFISQGFDNLQPFERFFMAPLAVWNHLDDARWMARYDRLANWYKSPKDLPGRMYLTAVEKLFQENQLVRGEFQVAGERVDLGRIECPLALVAGSEDHITPPAQVWAAEDATGSRSVLKEEIPAGHVGTFMGSRAVAEYWPGILNWLKEQESTGPSA